MLSKEYELKIKELCMKEIEKNSNNDKKLPSPCKLIQYRKENHMCRFVARRFKQLLTGERKDFYNTIYDYLDGFDLNALADEFPACLIWIINEAEKRKLSVASKLMITEDARNLIAKKFKEKYHEKETRRVNHE